MLRKFLVKFSFISDHYTVLMNKFNHYVDNKFEISMPNLIHGNARNVIIISSIEEFQQYSGTPVVLVQRANCGIFLLT